jgi:hypothetical protein
LEYIPSTIMVRKNSLAFLLIVLSGESNAFLTSCCVSVDPPSIFPLVTIFHAARAIPVKEKP